MCDCVQLAIRFLSSLFCSSARLLQAPPSPRSWGDAVTSRLQQLVGPAKEAPCFPAEADKEAAEEAFVLASTMLQAEKLPEIASLLHIHILPVQDDEEEEEAEFSTELLEELGAVVRSAVSLQRWTALLWTVRQRSVQVAVEHPLAREARALPQLPTATKRLQVRTSSSSSSSSASPLR